jgi:glutathione S-transferase
VSSTLFLLEDSRKPADFFPRLGFSWYHIERLPSAIERYSQEAYRIMGVIDLALESRDWLVGDKMSCVDLSFAPWFLYMPKLLGTETWARSKRELPRFHLWWSKLQNVPSVAEYSANDGIGDVDLNYARTDVKENLER